MAGPNRAHPGARRQRRHVGDLPPRVRCTAGGGALRPCPRAAGVPAWGGSTPRGAAPQCPAERPTATPRPPPPWSRAGGAVPVARRHPHRLRPAGRHHHAAQPLPALGPGPLPVRVPPSPLCFATITSDPAAQQLCELAGTIRLCSAPGWISQPIEHPIPPLLMAAIGAGTGARRGHS